MMQSSPYLSIRSLRVFTACLLSLLMFAAPMAPLAASVNRTNAARVAKKAAAKSARGTQKQLTAGEALERSLFVNPFAPPPVVGPIIGATMSDSFVDTSPVSGRADPGSIVTYNAVISNTGSGAGTGVNFMDTVDPNTTLINASIKFSPIAVNDAYNGTQNTTLNVSAPGVLTNDNGQPAPTAVPIGPAGPTTQGGTVTLNANGSFSYNPPNAGFTGTDTFTYSITNGQAPPNPTDAQATVTITVGTPNTAPVANDDTASATEAGGAANGTAGTNPAGNLITGVGAGSVTDTDAEDASSALIAVQVHTGPEGGSTGTGTINNPLAGTFGSLTLNTNGSYTYTVDNNNSSVQALRTSGQTLNDIFNYTIQDTGGLQDTATFTITIAGANDNPVAVADTPTAVEAGGTANGTAGTDPSGNVLTNDTDVDSVANGETKTVQGVAVGNQAGPLSTNVGVGLSGAGAANFGTLTIMADGSFAYVVNQSNATIEALGVGQTQTDTFSYTMKDAANVTSTTTVTVTIQGADDNPVAVNDAATVNEDAAATAVTVLTNDTDVDAGPKNIASVNQPANGTVVGTGPAGAFTGLTYQPNANYCNNPPGSTLDTFTYTLNGGSTATVSMTVTCINDAPTFTKGPDQNISEDAGPQTAAGWATGIGPGGGADEAGQTLTFVITNNTNSALFSSGPSVASNGTLTYTPAANASGTATITLKITDNGPTGGANVNESATQSFMINVAAVNDPPVVDLNGGAGGIDVAAAFTEDSGGVTLAPAATVSDVDDTNLESATITLTNRPDGAAESLSVNTAGTSIVAAAYVPGTGVLALSGTDTLANYQQVIRTAKYNNTSQNPTTTSRSITFTVNDGDVDSATATATVTVTAVNDAPVVDLNGTGTGGINTTATFTEDGGAIVMAGATDVTDVDSNNLVSATITLTNRPDGALESLSVDVTGTLITADAYVPGTGVLFLHGTDTVANYQQVLRTAKYNNTDQDPDTTARLVNFKANDGAVDSAVATATITVIAVNDAPVLAAIEGGALTYTENDAATSVTSTMTLTDVDSANMIGATVQITGNYQSGQDVLSFVNTPNITGSYNSGNGTMTLSGTDTKANYQAALRAVKYNNSSDDPSTLARTVTFQANDGGAVNNLSNTQTRNITVVAVNDPPTAFGFSALPAQAAIPIAYPAGKLGGTDLEAGTTITIDTVPINVINGTVVINANGSFTFTPSPGAVGVNTASFQYRVSDNGNPGPGVNGSYVTVSFTVAGPSIYFTKSAAVGLGNCTLGNECTIAQAVTNIGASTNANIFIEDANTQSPGAITLTSGSSIIGQGVVAASFDAFFGIGAPAQGTLAARPSVNQTRPTINGAATITAHNSTQLRGFDYTPTGNGLVATGRTGLVVSDMNITSTSNTGGQFAVNFGTSSGTFTFGPITVSGANIGGGVNFATTTSGSTVSFNDITTAGGPAFQASSTGSTNFTFNDVVSTTGRAVDLNTGTGAFTFHKIASTGGTTGVQVQSITGSFTVNGTSTTAGTGGTIQNASSNGMKFTSSNNITLKNMNLTNNATAQSSSANSCGNNLVAGDTTACTSNLFLNSVTTITINNLSITGSTQQGISGTAVSAMTLTGTTITGNGNEDFEDGFIFKNLTGTSTITNTTIQNNFSRQGHIYNSAGTLTLNVTGSSFGRTVAPLVSSQQGLLMQLANTSVSNVDIGTSSFNKNGNGNGLAITVTDTASLGSSGAHSSVHNSSSMTENAAHVFMSTGGSGTAFFDVTNNAVMTKAGLQGIDYFVGTNSTASGQITGVIQGNTIGTTGVASSACSAVGQGCDGMTLDKDGAGALSLRIQSNTIQQVNTNGISLGTTVSNALNASIISNTIREPAGGANQGNAMLFNVGANSGSTTTACLNIGGAGVQNIINSTSSWDINGSGSAIFFNTKNATVTRQPGYAGGSIDDVAFAAFTTGRNTFTSVGASPATFAQHFNGSTYGGGAACTVPLLFAAGGVESLLHAPSLLSTFALSPATAPIAGTRCGTSVANTATLSTPSLVSASLDQKQLDAITAAAVDRWISTGLRPGQVATLRGIKFVVADLGGEYLGESSNTQVQIDRNAGGKGWFTGADAASDSLFSRVVSSTRRYTDPLSAPAGHLDLLTAIEHELGHKLGLDDSYSLKDRDNLMYGYLTTGERRLPSQGQAGNARPGRQGTQHLKLRASATAVTRRTANAARRSDNPNTPLAGGTVNVTIGTLPAGKSVAITFQAQLNVSMPLGTTTVSTQGTVSGGNFASVLTDDQPGTAAPNEPTVTPVDSPTAAGSNVSGTILDSIGNPVEGAAIRISGTQNRLTVTDSNGFYHFEDVDTNGFYTVVPTRPNFTFNPSQRSFSQLGNHTDAVFTATAGSSGFVNPLDETVYFVRQQYVDFLGREPDESGLGFWVNNVEGCGADANCRAGKRIDTSAAFFLSIEFQQTGYLVYKTYQAAFGDIAGAPVPIKLGEFKPDTAAISKDVVVNATGWQAKLDANTVIYMSDFVQRARFTSAYPVSMTPQAFVDKLFAAANVMPTDGDRTAAVNEFAGAGTTADVAARGRALRRVAENSLLSQQEFNQAFVLMQYFGYLRRDPNSGQDTDFTGYNFWLSKLNTFNGNFSDAEMVKSFLVAGEYRGRFPR